MDEIDLAQEREGEFIAAALLARHPVLKSPNGKCIWCKEHCVTGDSAFCSADCGEDYFKHKRQVKMNQRTEL